MYSRSIIYISHRFLPPLSPPFQFCHCRVVSWQGWLRPIPQRWRFSKPKKVRVFFHFFIDVLSFHHTYLTLSPPPSLPHSSSAIGEWCHDGDGFVRSLKGDAFRNRKRCVPCVIFLLMWYSRTIIYITHCLLPPLSPPFQFCHWRGLPWRGWLCPSPQRWRFSKPKKVLVSFPFFIVVLFIHHIHLTIYPPPALSPIPVPPSSRGAMCEKASSVSMKVVVCDTGKCECPFFDLCDVFSVHPIHYLLSSSSALFPIPVTEDSECCRKKNLLMNCLFIIFISHCLLPPLPSLIQFRNWRVVPITSFIVPADMLTEILGICLVFWTETHNSAVPRFMFSYLSGTYTDRIHRCYCGRRKW